MHVCVRVCKRERKEKMKYMCVSVRELLSINASV